MAKILLVEDEMVIALSASFALEGEGYEIVMASNGRDGLAKCQAEKPDLIITDYMMPRMDGVEMMQRIRQAGFTTPVIVATSIAEERLAALAGGLYDAFLGKPYHDEDLLKVVHGIIGPADHPRERR